MLQNNYKKGSKDSFFSPKSLVNVKGNLMDLSTPKVMGIINATPDSFYKASRVESLPDVTEQVGRMLEDGMDILDIGGYSSRPGAQNVDVQEEMDRVVATIEKLSCAFPSLPISIDTFRSAVAKEAVRAGAGMVNDISGGSADEAMYETVAALKTPYVIMHMQGTPQDMQDAPLYDDVVKDVINYLQYKVQAATDAGILDIIIDPGFGFGKTVDHNYRLAASLPDFRIFGLPVLVGFSRKSMINKVLKTTPKDALNGTTVLHTFALMNGVSILRTHDVKEARQAITIVEMLKEHSAE